jgi:hypothetical protein
MGILKGLEDLPEVIAGRNSTSPICFAETQIESEYMELVLQ